MAKLHVDIANCPINGPIELSLSGYAVLIYQTEDGMPPKHQAAKGRTVHTTTIEFGEIRPHRARRAESVADDIAWLLSFATMSPVRPFSYRHGQEGRTYSITQKTVIFRPTIDTIDTTLVRNFLTSTWRQFRHLKRTFLLKRIIDYLVIAEYPDQPIEVKALLCFTALESLSRHILRDFKGIFGRVWAGCLETSECAGACVS